MDVPPPEDSSRAPSMSVYRRLKAQGQTVAMPAWKEIDLLRADLAAAILLMTPEQARNFHQISPRPATMQLELNHYVYRDEHGDEWELVPTGDRAMPLTITPRRFTQGRPWKLHSRQTLKSEQP